MYGASRCFGLLRATKFSEKRDVPASDPSIINVSSTRLSFLDAVEGVLGAKRFLAAAVVPVDLPLGFLDPYHKIAPLLVWSLPACNARLLLANSSCWSRVGRRPWSACHLSATSLSIIQASEYARQ